LRILVHTCCAPCGTYVFERLHEDGHQFEAHYYNPNIHPAEEYEKRRATLEDYAQRIGLKTHFDTYNPSEYWEAIGADQSHPKRCAGCYRVRLKRTAHKAKVEGFEAFTTTLLISPYQDHEALRRVAEEVAAAEGVAFHYEDYRVGYRRSRQLLREAGLYSQKYCGCSLQSGRTLDIGRISR
jgi:predicted adenine nucleotide alpha hydrolase (AANH) superfamily ATPase